MLLFINRDKSRVMCATCYESFFFFFKFGLKKMQLTIPTEYRFSEKAFPKCRIVRLGNVISRSE